MSRQPELKIIDGRRKRSERSRAAIITATLNLIDNGNFAPTARQISEEAGIGLRSFFRHFDDMEALMDTIDQHMRGYYEPLFVRPFKDGTLEERIEDIVIDRSEAYERLKNNDDLAGAIMALGSGAEKLCTQSKRLAQAFGKMAARIEKPKSGQSRSGACGSII